VFYVNQIQRQKPYPGLINYFRQKEPVFQFDAGAGVDSPWVAVYPAPAAQSAGGAPKIEGVAQLLAYKVAGKNPDLSLTLFLRALGPLPNDTTIGAALSDGETTWGNWNPEQINKDWQTDEIIEWRGRLDNLPPGEYRLEAVFQFKDGPVIAEFDISDKDLPMVIQ
jgi:hypothetical protein